MAKQYLITFRSVTFAQQGERILRKAGIAAVLQRTPRSLSQRGCGYCLRLRAADAPMAVELLRENGVGFEKVFAQEEGRTEERML